MGETMSRVVRALLLGSCVVVLLACGGSKKTTTTPAAQTNQQQTPAQSGTDSSAQSGTDSSASAASGELKVTFKSAATCHSQKRAGGNSDVLIELSVTGIKDGAEVNLNFGSTEQGAVAGDGIVKGGKVLVRIPAVAVGEQFALLGISVDSGEFLTDAQTSGFSEPVHTVPPLPGKQEDCALDQPELDANGSLNTPNPANAGGPNPN